MRPPKKTTREPFAVGHARARPGVSEIRMNPSHRPRGDHTPNAAHEYS
jgi:hypothetical protein